jgi:hypothetical protein
MCCETHDLRDFLTRAHGGEDALRGVLAPADNRRCRCTELGKWGGQACAREANGEDLLCDWCRVTDHMRWYETALRGGDPVAQAYYEQRGAVTFGRSGSGALSARASLAAADEAPGWGDPAADISGDIRRAVAEAGSYGNRYAAAAGPVIPAGKIDFRFEFSAQEIAAMRAASGGDDSFGLRSMRIELQQEMTAEQVMRYVRGRFGV